MGITGSDENAGPQENDGPDSRAGKTQDRAKSRRDATVFHPVLSFFSPAECRTIIF